MQKSANTHRRVLIYFLVEMGIIDVDLAAEYFYKTTLKLGTIEEIKETFNY